MYDPVPDLAALIDGLRDAARYGGSPAKLGKMLGSSYARLRGGLLLDEPGREHVTTEAAIREALGQPAVSAETLPQVPYPPDSTFAWIEPSPEMYARHRDLPVTNAATAITSWIQLTNYYQGVWPPDRYQKVRRRLLTLAGNLPEPERERIPAWLLQLIHSDLREPGQ